ncbi:MAG: T9SS type A sorting domain-containing protein [Bacteroidota bacterium]
MKKIFSTLLLVCLLIHNDLLSQLVVSNDTTICAGQSVQLSVSGGTAYSWAPSNTLSSSSSSTPLATPTQTTTYVVSSPLNNANMVVNGDFSQGNTGFTSDYTFQLPPNNVGQGRYWVGSTPSSFSSGMANCGDHTGGGGNMIIANAAQTLNTPVWCQTLVVYPNSTYTLSGWIQTLNQTNLPKAQWMVNGTPIGTAVGTFLSCFWVRFTATWNSGNDTVATFCAFDPDTAWNGNDFAMDDFSITGTGTMYDSVTVSIVPAPVVNLGNDTSICGNFSILLNAQNFGSNFLWNDNSTQQTNLVTVSGTYSVTVTDANFCTASSDIVVNSSSLNPPVISTSHPQICSSDTAVICPVGSFTSYLWNTGETTSCIGTSLSGSYYVTITDMNNCTAESNRVTITAYPAPAVSISVNGDTLSSYDAVSYQWYLNGSPINGANAGIYIATQSGNYLVQVTDSNGCRANSTVISLVTGIDDLNEAGGIHVYPNPSMNGRWQLEVAEEWIGSMAEVLDAEGRLIFKSEIRNMKSEIKSANEIPNGMYLLKIKSSQTTNCKKLIRL